MNTNTALAPDQNFLDIAIEQACSIVAPTWPLDRFIAVNPYWSWVKQDFSKTASSLALLSGTSMTMPRSYYRDAWTNKQFDAKHLAQAIEEMAVETTSEAVIADLQRSATASESLRLLSDQLDAERDLSHAPSWNTTITHQVSQFCAAHFDSDQSDWHPMHDRGLYEAWRTTFERDHSISLLMGNPDIARRASSLPTDARATIAMVLAALAVPVDMAPLLFQATLLRMNGWASWCAYLRWQANFEQKAETHLLDLLAIRLAWEWLIDDGKRDETSAWANWQKKFKQTYLRDQSTSETGRAPVNTEMLIQRAMEIAYQTTLVRNLSRTTSSTSGPIPAVQAAFCIDVRSEVFRRALEKVAPSIQTLGFAGFFGLPIDYTPLGTAATRPQLPGLLAAAMHVEDSSNDAQQDRAIASTRLRDLGARKVWQQFQRQPGSGFALVESLGATYLGKLIKRSTPSTKARTSYEQPWLGSAPTVRPRLQIAGSDAAAQKAALAQRILKAMGLTENFARVVLLAGHGSQTSNNPHAAGLDCGACCGQTGEVNARTLAALLNEPAVRSELASMGIHIPETTHILAGLHNTTTDEIELFDTDLLPTTHAQDLLALEQSLQLAGQAARIERAPALGITNPTADADADVLLRTLKTRANNWAQLRPEWGLANNAAFIVAPRSRTQSINLQGRAFLHDYQWEKDTDASILELIMTAPMVVAHWINMQYYASTVDNTRYGSGNKVLHNVVGAHIGVFEGNGGDLRIGLPMQSVHDGVKWMHTPLRLSVVIEAPKHRIEAIIAKHEVVRNLVERQWLHLFQIESETNQISAFKQGQWEFQTGHVR